MQKGVQYNELDISVNNNARNRLAKLGGQGVPAFLIGDEFIVGFDRGRLEKLLQGKIAECPMCRTKHRIPENKGRIRITCSQCSTKFEVNT